MKTKDYVRLFKLDKPFYEFSREKFLNELGREFNQRVEDTIFDREWWFVDFSFSIFNNIVKDIVILFWSICNNILGLPFSEKLFSSFFAGWIIPIRKKYFPKEDQELTLKWERKKLEMQKSEEPKKPNTIKKPKNNKSLSHKTSN